MNNYINEEESARPVALNQRDYDWDKPLQAGDIVLSSYCNFDNDRTVGLFLVLYDEQLDSDVLESKNVMALKLSSQTTLLSNYVVRVPMGRNTFLNSPSLVCCSKVHVLHKCKNVYNVLGKLDQGTLKLVYKQYKKFMNDVDRQILDSI